MTNQLMLGLIIIAALLLVYLIQRQHNKPRRRRRKPVVGRLLDRAKLRPAVHKTRVVPTSKVPELRPVPDPDFPNPGRYESRKANGAKPPTPQREQIRRLEVHRSALMELAEMQGYGAEAQALLDDLDEELGREIDADAVRNRAASVELFSMDEYRQHRAEEL